MPTHFNFLTSLRLKPWRPQALPVTLSLTHLNALTIPWLEPRQLQIPSPILFGALTNLHPVKLPVVGAITAPSHTRAGIYHKQGQLA